MEKEELNKYKIRDYYMIPTEIVDNIFYEFETQLKKQKEIIDKVSTRLEYFLIGNLKYQSSQEEFIKLLNILEDKEV